MDIIREVNPESILDIGVGTGYYGEMIRRDFPNILLDGVETFDYSNYRWNCYNNIIRDDIRLINVKEYELFLMIDVIEHMRVDEGLELLLRLKGPVLVSTPWYFPQNADENPLQEHVSSWTLEDFSSYRYTNYSNYLSLIILVERKV